MRSHGRGIAGKAAFTKKCSCENPQWYSDHIETNNNTGEITYVLNCRNCKAYWGTKSHEARQYWASELDAVPLTWAGYGYKGDKTVRQLFQELDEHRLSVLEAIAVRCEAELAEAQKAVSKAHKDIEKYKAIMETNK